jgi:hypothetical protein
VTPYETSFSTLNADPTQNIDALGKYPEVAQVQMLALDNPTGINKSTISTAVNMFTTVSNNTYTHTERTNDTNKGYLNLDQPLSIS